MKREDYFSRYDRIASLGNRKTLQQREDEEQAAYLDQWHRDNPNGGWFNRAALGIVAIIALGIGCVILSRPPIPAYPVPPAPHAFIDTCLTCHFPRPATEAKTYAEHRNKPRFKVPPVDLPAIGARQ